MICSVSPASLLKLNSCILIWNPWPGRLQSIGGQSTGETWEQVLLAGVSGMRMPPDFPGHGGAQDASGCLPGPELEDQCRYTSIHSLWALNTPRSSKHRCSPWPANSKNLNPTEMDPLEPLWWVFTWRRNTRSLIHKGSWDIPGSLAYYPGGATVSSGGTVLPRGLELPDLQL